MISRTIIILWFFALSLGILCGRSAGEAKWQDETFGVTDEEFYSLAESPDGKMKYLGTSGGLYKKSDKEKAWRRIFTCRGEFRGVNYVFVDPKDAIYLATKNGLYKSNNHGLDWKRFFRGIDEENHCVYITAREGSENIFYLGTRKGLFLTNNGGQSWERPSGKLAKSPVTAIAVTKKTENKQLFVIANNEVYRATSLFETYEKVFGSGYEEPVETDAADFEEETGDKTGLILSNILINEDSVYLTTNRGIFKSADNGSSWLRLDSAGLTTRDINDILITPDGKIFVATRKGVFEYNRDKKIWSAIYYGMEDEKARRLLSAKNTKLWVVCKRRVYKTELNNTGLLSSESVKVKRIFSRFQDEPNINEVMDMAINYAEVYPGKISQWRSQVKFKALLPKVNFGIDRGASDTYEIYTSSSNSYWVDGPRDTSDGWDLSLSWDLSDLIWNPSQTTIDIRSKLMVQLRDDILDEVTRSYFERRRLQIELLTGPPAELPLLLTKRLRIQELTANIDGLTGGDFSKSIEKQ